MNIHHGYNFRDLGGYQTTDGLHLRAHRLVRSGAMDRLSDRDVAFLHTYGVRVDVDFRSRDERLEKPDRLPDSARYVFDPVFSEDKTQVSKTWAQEQQMFSLDAKAGYHNMLRTYRDLALSESAQKAYREFFDLALGNSSDTLLFHCSAGKDRTGMAAVYVLSALGVDEATIRKDYLATNLFIQPALEEVLTQAKAEGGNQNMMQGLTDIWTVYPEYLDTALAAIKDTYGDMQHYLTEALQLTNHQIQTLRKLYLV
ncbi:tyrosine-protein phosphatase [Lacticaseibacillus camelliae]|uniref:Protein tyrosine serine phosphatase n=1 Tax=Lacticaseibacillus camelliae DSM 22697 = JCM 13995 TaxID=1423730 RepID=A0A0R2FMZ3_9LACO|nr:tyrosine-protein phosphatase [Lacticaseibacillus camelliae]KRN25636.1 protein tyrosine serine phosphatase [Lacticaseibacillus camelliae DSM 22697 = JCM 13995]